MDRCPSCNTPIDREQAVDGVAQCGSCEAVFELGREPVEASDVPPSPPPGVRYTAHEHGAEIVLSWRADVNLGGHLVHLLLIAFCLVWAVAGQDWTRIFGLLLGGVLSYAYLFTLVNRTTILVGRGGVEVSHGPLPSFRRGGTYPAAHLRPLVIDKVVRYSRNNRSVTYELEGLHGRLLTNWNHQETLLFVRDCIAATVNDGTADQPTSIHTELPDRATG